MLRGARSSVKLHHTSQSARRLYSQVLSSAGRNRGVLVASAAAVTAATFWYSTDGVIHNDAPVFQNAPTEKVPVQQPSVSFANGDETLNTLVWGSNKCASTSLCGPDIGHLADVACDTEHTSSLWTVMLPTQSARPQLLHGSRTSHCAIWRYTSVMQHVWMLGGMYTSGETDSTTRQARPRASLPSLYGQK